MSNDISNEQHYNYDVVRKFALMTIVWGIVGMGLGVLLAAQLVWPEVNLDYSWSHFGRLRPLHTNAVIFAFGGCALMGSSFFVVQRTCQVPLISNKLASIVFWGWQLVIVLAAITLPMGITSTKEYAELEWPIDLLIAFIWLLYAIVFFGTIAKRKVEHIYIANWFYAALIVGVGVLHTVNNLPLIVSVTKSYSIYSGATDALIQWWYGHNAVGFLLTAGFISMLYYFLPKQSETPIYSYRLTIVNFWGLIGLYIWAGSHHLHFTALPDWVENLGMVMSIILFLPSWGTVINGVMTLALAWKKLTYDPTLRFMALALSFYAMATFEGSMMAIKTVNAMSHFTDWTVAHVHSGALGWVAMITIGMLYYLIPVVFHRKQMYSEKLIHWHFWLAVVGTVLYVVSMWVNGFMQGLMWRATNTDGSLTYSFIDALVASYPGYFVRFVGGALFLLGMLVMAYNTWKTIARSPAQIPANNTEIQAV
jgi:cytochrome c oxidase cbb3-type subunit 1